LTESGLPETHCHPPTLATDFFGSEGWGFESLRARHTLATSVTDKLRLEAPVQDVSKQ